MSLEEFSQRVAQDEIKHSQTQSPSDPYYPQKSRTAYAKRLLEDLPKDVDLDSYCMTVYPSELLTLFSGSTPVNLVSHKPFIRDVEEYRDWVYIGQSVAMFLISPRFKEPLLHELERLNYTVDFSQYKYVLIKGNQVTVMGVLVHCLTAIDCDAVRIRVYNLKAPIRLLSELYTFHSSHPLRFTNFFDVGVTEKQDIAGLSLLKGVGPLTKTFPICSPAAKGYGTVRLQTKISHKFVNALALEHQIVETKMYSKVAHVIRSIGVRPSLFNGKTCNI
ncbi:OTU-domain-containing protein, partial [Wallemia mellicola]